MKKITFLLVLLSMTCFFALGEQTHFNNSEANSETFVITISVEPAEGGTVSGGSSGTYEYGEIITLVATPASGYRFGWWLCNGTVVSKETVWTFTVVEDKTITALFEGDNYNITVSASPSSFGTVSGGGNYAAGEVVSISATPTSAAYAFVGWTLNGEEYPAEHTFEFTVTANANFVAHFDQVGWDFFTITLLSNPPDVCSVVGGGDFLNGYYCTVYAFGCYDGYEYDFVNWLEDGEEVSSQPYFSFVVTRDRVLVANYERYEIDVVSSNPEYGEVQGSGNFAPGIQATVTAIPNSGYELVNWTKNGVIVSTNESYTFITPLESIELVANFEKSILSIETIETSSIKIYPNPTGGELKIVCGKLKVENIEIYDAFGKKVGVTCTNTAETTIDISHLSAGVYFVKIQTETGEVVRKVVKE